MPRARLSLVVLPVDAARHVRMRCVTQRCQAAPWNVSAAIAFAPSPSWASETTRRTPSAPRALQAGEERLPPAWLSVSAIHADEALVAVSSSPIAVDGLGRRAPSAALHVGGVEPQVGRSAPPSKRCLLNASTLGVQALAQARHLRLRHRPHAELARRPPPCASISPRATSRPPAATSASPPCSSARSGLGKNEPRRSFRS